ncbi:hypothetical protein [Kitasatospora sp. NPDC059327]|uniref:hypothetical protein n=1 Tax=Kitasatospora sp. NPDC059327 TaxID=3346803 RepID=UPI0036809810
MVNERLRRVRLLAELTQEQVAAKVQARLCDLRERQEHSNKRTVRHAAFDAKQLSRLETGDVTWPGRDVRNALCHVLGVATAAELGLYSRKSRLPEGVRTSQRRTLLAGSLAGLVPVPSLASAPSRLGMDDLDAVQERVRALSALDRQSGGAPVRFYALDDLNRALGLTKASMTPAVRRRLCGVIADLANLGAWSSFDAGLSGQSRPTFRLGIDAAREARDADSLCHLTTNLARQEIQERNPAQALALADAAVDGNLSCAALAMVEAVRAQAHALQGDEGQVLRCMNAAEGIYARSTDPHSGPAWTWAITPEKLSSDTGYGLFLMAITTGRHAPDLVRTLRAAEERTDTSRARVKALVGARLATVLYLQGAREEADHHAASATALASRVTSARLDLALAQMRAKATTT